MNVFEMITLTSYIFVIDCSYDSINQPYIFSRVEKRVNCFDRQLAPPRMVCVRLMPDLQVPRSHGPVMLIFTILLKFDIGCESSLITYLLEKL